MSEDPAAEARTAVSAVVVQAVFHVADEPQAQAVAARMVDRAHEIANLPECECDVDVSIERTRAEITHLVDPSDASASGRYANP